MALGSREAHSLYTVDSSPAITSFTEEGWKALHAQTGTRKQPDGRVDTA